VLGRRHRSQTDPPWKTFCSRVSATAQEFRLAKALEEKSWSSA